MGSSFLTLLSPCIRWQQGLPQLCQVIMLPGLCWKLVKLQLLSEVRLQSLQPKLVCHLAENLFQLMSLCRIYASSLKYVWLQYCVNIFHYSISCSGFQYHPNGGGLGLGNSITVVCAHQIESKEPKPPAPAPSNVKDGEAETTGRVELNSEGVTPPQAAKVGELSVPCSFQVLSFCSLDILIPPGFC